MIFIKESVVQCNILCAQNHTKKRKLDSCLMSIDCQYKGRNLCREKLTGSNINLCGENRNGYAIKPEILETKSII